MENRKGNGIFLSVIGVATLIVAIIGATFAYFSASAASNNQAIAIQSTEIDIGFYDDVDDLSVDLIPAAERYALYAGTNTAWINDEDGPGLCKDDNLNSICGVYTFTIANTSYNTEMEISGNVKVAVNQFSNLKFALYDENGTQVKGPTAFPTNTGGTIDLNITQRLSGSSNNNPTSAPINIEQQSSILKVDPDNDGIASNMRTYKMVIWIEEWINPETGAAGDQTSMDSGKMFTAGVNISTGTGAGITGIITAADAAQNPDDNG